MADSLHVMPLNDLVGHEADPDCVCGPTPEPVFKQGMVKGWVYTHHSFDGREAAEEGGTE